MSETRPFDSRGPSLQDQTWCQILGPKPGPVAEFKNWDLRVSVSVCVCCFLSFSVFLCLSLSLFYRQSAL